MAPGSGLNRDNAGVIPSAPAASFDQPFELLAGCHDRVRRSLALLQRLVAHLRTHGADRDARSAAADVLRYFDVAGPQHHLDEERHVLPLLEASGDAALVDAAQRLHDEHRELDAQWQALRALLEALDDVDALARQADAFVALYRRHLPLEDELVFPAAQRLMVARGEAAVEAMGREMAARRGAPFKESGERADR
jgi:hemerythrin-like domain-containing protein